MSTPLKDRMFFIVGRGRSGTTLLVRLLDAHPAIAVAPESLFILYLKRKYQNAGWRDPEAIRHFARDLWKEERMRRWQLDPGALEKRLLAVENPDFATLCAEVYRANAEVRDSGEALLLGDKNPHYALFVEELAALFPAARFLYLTRFYPANILSYRKVRFDLSSVSALAERWRRYNQGVWQVARRLPERFLQVRYEELVENPQGQLETICRFLGVPFTPEMLADSAAVKENLPEWHRNLSQAPDPQHRDKWRRELTPKQLRLADAVCQPLGRELGYSAAGEERLIPLLQALPGVVWASIITFLERSLFWMPLDLRARLIRLYRISTGNRIR
jgi:hypothetical protein